MVVVELEGETQALNARSLRPEGGELVEEDSGEVEIPFAFFFGGVGGTTFQTCGSGGESKRGDEDAEVVWSPLSSGLRLFATDLGEWDPCLPDLLRDLKDGTFNVSSSLDLGFVDFASKTRPSPPASSLSDCVTSSCRRLGRLILTSIGDSSPSVSAHIAMSSVEPNGVCLKLEPGGVLGTRRE